MKKAIVFTTALLVCLHGAVVAQENQERNPETEAVRGIIESLAVHVQARNFTALDTLYAPGPGVHIIEGAGVDHGWEAYRDEHLRPELDASENFRYRYFAIEPVVRDNVAWSAFRYEVSADMSGRSIDIEGRGTAVLEKQGGRWRVVHLHTSGRPRG